MTDTPHTALGKAWAAFTEFLHHVYHTHGFQEFEATAGDVAKHALAASIAAGMAAKVNGGDIHAVEKAAGGAAVTVGVAEGSDLAVKIVNAVGASLHPVEAAPLPPVPQSAPPVDNDHVAPGCVQFTDAEIAANAAPAHANLPEAAAETAGAV